MKIVMIARLYPIYSLLSSPMRLGQLPCFQAAVKLSPDPASYRGWRGVEHVHRLLTICVCSGNLLRMIDGPLLTSIPHKLPDSRTRGSVRRVSGSYKSPLHMDRARSEKLAIKMCIRDRWKVLCTRRTHAQRHPRTGQ